MPRTLPAQESSTLDKNRQAVLDTIQARQNGIWDQLRDLEQDADSYLETKIKLAEIRKAVEEHARRLILEIQKQQVSNTVVVKSTPIYEQIRELREDIIRCERVADDNMRRRTDFLKQLEEFKKRERPVSAGADRGRTIALAERIRALLEESIMSRPRDLDKESRLLSSLKLVDDLDHMGRRLVNATASSDQNLLTARLYQLLDKIEASSFSESRQYWKGIYDIKNGLYGEIDKLESPSSEGASSSVSGIESSVQPARLVRIRQILLHINKGTPGEEQKVADRAQFILKKAREGTDFAALAREFSQDATGPSGGDLGWIQTREAFGGQFSQSLATMKKGEVSGLERSQLGIHIFKIEDVGESGPAASVVAKTEQADRTPPDISLSSPTLSRSLILVERRQSFEIRGKATDPSGVVTVTVNGDETSLDAAGNFSREVLLAVGENRFTVQAIDTKSNQGEVSFSINREAVQVAGAVPPSLSTNQPGRTATSPDMRPRSRALLIGVGTYEKWNKLENPLLDIDAIGKELDKNYGFTVDYLRNPSRVQMFNALRDLSTKACGSDEQLLVMFSGHGHFDEVGKVGYLVARDTARPKDDLLFDTFVDQERVKRMLAGTSCGHVLLVLDSCFSGTLDYKIAMKGEGDDVYADIPRENFIRSRMKYRTRRYLTSGGKVYVPDGRPGQHSPFARRLLEGLRGYGGGDGILTLDELVSVHMARVQPEVHVGELEGNEPGSTFLFVANGSDK